MKSALLHRATLLAVPVILCTAWTEVTLAQAPPPPAPAPAPPAPMVMTPAPTPAPAPKYPMTTITGYVEGAYHKVLESGGFDTVLLTRAYDTANGFQLHAAHFQLEHMATENVAGHFEFDMGSDAAVNNFTFSPVTTPPVARGLETDVPQAYVKLSDYGFTFTAGKFFTYQGIEVINGPANPTVTRGFLFFLAEPVSHVGAKLHYATGPLDVGVGLVNGWDTNGVFYTSDNNNMKTLIFRAAVAPIPQFSAALSGTYGVERPASDVDPRLSLDLTGAVIPNDMITINFQGNFGTEKNAGLPDPATMAATDASWFGFGVQPVVKIAAATIGARFEFFKDKNGGRTLIANDPSYLNFTITPGYTFGGALSVRGEFRIDTASQPVLGLDHTKKSQSTIAFGVGYTF